MSKYLLWNGRVICVEMSTSLFIYFAQNSRVIVIWKTQLIHNVVYEYLLGEKSIASRELSFIRESSSNVIIEMYRVFFLSTQ